MNTPNLSSTWPSRFGPRSQTITSQCHSLMKAPTQLCLEANLSVGIGLYLKHFLQRRSTDCHLVSELHSYLRLILLRLRAWLLIAHFKHQRRHHTLDCHSRASYSTTDLFPKQFSTNVFRVSQQFDSLARFHRTRDRTLRPS
jgi:hypothetical protein